MHMQPHIIWILYLTLLVWGGTMPMCPHFFQMAISPWKKGSGGLKFLDFSWFIVNFQKIKKKLLVYSQCFGVILTYIVPPAYAQIPKKWPFERMLKDPKNDPLSIRSRTQKMTLWAYAQGPKKWPFERTLKDTFLLYIFTWEVHDEPLDSVR